MKKEVFRKYSVWSALGIAPLLLLAVFFHVDAFAAGTACPRKIENFPAQPNCTSERNCSQCKAAYTKAKASVDKFNTGSSNCTNAQATCSEAVEAAPGGDDQYNNMVAAGGKAGKGAACYRAIAALANKGATDARGCASELKRACGGIEGADQDREKCEQAAKEAETKAKEATNKGNDAQKNADKNADNAKKEGSGGGMPQIPQIPQNKGGDEQQPQPSQQATSPTPENNKPEEKPEIESAKLNGDDKLTSPIVGFGGSSTDTNTSTIHTPGGSFPAFHDEGRKLADNGFGANNVGNGANTSTGGAVGGGGGGGGMNSTGASLPGNGEKGAPEAAKNDNGGNEFNMSSGGKLGAPKGYKGGGDSDGAIADAAKTDFKNDFAAPGDKGVGMADGLSSNPADDPDNGYTIFKMITYRYKELKKRGGI